MWDEVELSHITNMTKGRLLTEWVNGLMDYWQANHNRESKGTKTARSEDKHLNKRISKRSNKSPFGQIHRTFS